MVSTIQEAKARVVAEKNKVVSATRAVIGSRALLAVLTMLMVGFGAHAIYFPQRLPPIEGLSLASFGLPSSVDFGVVGHEAQEAGAAAIRQGAPAKITEFVAAHQSQIPLYNLIGFVLCALLLVWNLLAAASKWRGARGVTMGAP